MKKDYTNKFILNALNLPVVKDLNDISMILRLSTRLLYVLSKQTEDYYRDKTILKKNGSIRMIKIPNFSLKLIQKWILNNILEKVSVSCDSMAFRKGRQYGIKRNAEIHLHNVYVMVIDLEDFFTTIKKEKIFYIFRNLGYNNLVSNTFSNLCTYDKYLPQGAVTSPYLSNLVCDYLDRRIRGLCSNHDVSYSRYADDLIFSNNNKKILLSLKKTIEKIIEDEGFIINKSKTKFFSPAGRKVITGITVNNGKLKANKKLKRKVRAMIYEVITKGDYKSSNKIKGYISHISYVENDYKNKIIKYIDKIAKNKIINNKELVEKYNLNKFYKELESVDVK